MSKELLIQAICERKRTVGRDYLVAFDEQQLETYLRRLTQLIGKRGRDSAWVRPADSHAVVSSS